MRFSFPSGRLKSQITLEVHNCYFWFSDDMKYDFCSLLIEGTSWWFMLSGGSSASALLRQSLDQSCSSYWVVCQGYYITTLLRCSTAPSIRAGGYQEETLTPSYLGIVPTAAAAVLTLLQSLLAVLRYLLQVVPQDVLPPVTAGEAPVQSLQVQVFSLQVAELGLYGLPLGYDNLEQSLKIGTVGLCHYCQKPGWAWGIH